MTIWLLDDIDGWRARLRRPVWALHLGRSQDSDHAPESVEDQPSRSE
ncbi:hypothetical protein [Dactylosporangium sp. CA-092794]